MRDEEIRIMANLEDSHWWYQGLRKICVALLMDASDASRIQRGEAVIVDIGSGTGGMLKHVAETPSLASACRIGIDSSRVATAIAANRDLHSYYVTGDANQLPISTASSDFIMCLNVLEHSSITPNVVLAEIERCLAPGGCAIINVAAYGWMFSFHDEAVSQVRRFSKRQLIGLVQDAGLVIRYATYWNCILLPVMILRRLVFQSKDGESDLRRPNQVQQFIGQLALRIEARALKSERSLPFGGAVLVVVEKL